MEECGEGAHCPGTRIEVGDLTWNLAPMLAKALELPGADLGGGEHCFPWVNGGDPAARYGILAFDMAPALEAAGPIAQAIARMKAAPDEFRAMNPKNGWGTYEGALEFMEKFYMACCDRPSWRIRVR